jgi:flagellar protein FliS
MVYDFCLQWCDRALEASQQIEVRTRAITKIQDGIMELTCALDMDRGGDIARNLWRLYDYMGWRLQSALRERSDAGIQEVRRLMSDLRSAWAVAAEEIRRTQPSLVTGTAHGMALVG